MITPIIKNEEFLYRRIIKNPNFWKADLNRHSSAAFKQSNGLSVDRQLNRDELKVIESIQKDSLKAISSISCKNCRSIPTYPNYDPLENNIYHAEIYGTPNNRNLTQSQYKKLSNLANPIWIADLE